MYDRASRQLLWNSGCTPKDVGPGTYEVAEFEGVARGRGKGRAPFLTMSDRQACSQLLNDEMTSTPGPGAYDPDAVQPRVLGGSTLDTRERRFKHRVADTPGPGYYEVERQTTDWADHTHITSKDMVESAASGKLVSSRIRYRRHADAPSIPSQGMSYGYVEHRDGTLSKLCPPKKDCSMGPAFYEQALVEARSTRQYRGIHFGKMAPRKIDMLGYRSENPGPGTYNPQGAGGGGGGGGGDRWAEDRNPTTAGAPAAPTKPPVYKIPRYCDAIVRETEKLNYPGPGRYQIRSQFDPQPPRITPLEGLEMEKPPFLSQAKRFNPLKTYVPAPGTYNDPRTALTCLNKLRGLTQSPFGKTSPRFQKGQRNKIAPGPGTYGCPRGMGMESLRKAHYESTRKGVFGTTASRSLPGQAQEARNQPGPAHYTPKPRPFQSRYIQPSSIFSSHTDRLTKPPGLVEGAPAPGSYEVVKSYDRSQVHTEMAKPRTLAASLKHSSFVCCAPRFQAGNRQAVPGPGTYECKETLRKKRAPIVSTDQRFQYRVNNFPGPGTYEFTPAVRDSILKGTFNVTLNNPLMAPPSSPPVSAARALSPAIQIA